jgi:hypothetical protein
VKPSWLHLVVHPEVSLTPQERVRAVDAISAHVAIDGVDLNGDTALHDAAAILDGAVLLIASLLDHGAQVNARNKKGECCGSFVVLAYLVWCATSTESRREECARLVIAVTTLS